MQQTSNAFLPAIEEDARAIFLRAVVDISDPDKRFLPVTGSPQAPWSRAEQIHDKVFDAPARYSTFEPGRTLLGGGFFLFPTDYNVPEQMGFCGAALSGPDCVFSEPQTVSLNFEDMSILQAFSVFFSTDPLNGVPEDFTVEVIQGTTAYFSQEVTGNSATSMQFKNFTVYNPIAIRLTVTKWSLPGRRLRVVEIVPGIYEDWDAEDLDSFRVQQQGQFSCLTIPYGTAEIGIDNSDRRFEPRRKDGVFQSIEARQGVELFIGTLLASGASEYKGLGTFYQAGDGWKTSQNEMTMRWSLVDIVGLVANRAFIVPTALPTTLRGWIQAVVLQLGDNFAKRFRVDPNYANASVTAVDRDAVSGASCGDILRWACMAAGVWPRAAAEDGRLAAEPLWNQGAKLDLDNMVSYPSMRANESLAALIFQLSDGTEFVVSGNATSSEKTVTIQNPFLHTQAQALTAARLILSQYGGNVYDITYRGNPASEIGDVDTIWLDESNAATGRRISQTFQIQDHVLKNCTAKLLQADGSYLWTEYAVIRESGTWTAPAGVSQLRIVLGQGGQGSGPGGDGYITLAGNLGNSMEAGPGEDGVDGHGGKIWYGVIDINPQQEFTVVLGQGGAPGTVVGQPGYEGGHTSFGAYTSEEGQLYPGGYTDIANGQAFARTGVEVPLPGTGDGAKGGAGGDPGVGYLRTEKRLHGGTDKVVLVVQKPGGPGHPGVRGATGFVMVTWEKPVEEALAYGE